MCMPSNFKEEKLLLDLVLFPCLISAPACSCFKFFQPQFSHTKFHVCRQENWKNDRKGVQPPLKIKMEEE